MISLVTVDNIYVMNCMGEDSYVLKQLHAL